MISHEFFNFFEGVVMKKKLLLLSVSAFFSVCFVKSQEPRVKLYTCYTDSHEVLFKEWFLPSIQDDYDIVVKKFEQTCQSAKFLEKGWKDTTLKKVDLIIQAVKETMGAVFIWSDPDIQFFTKTKDILLRALEGHDIVCQRIGFGLNGVCSGFFICHSNKRTLELWKSVKRRMLNSPGSDQASLNYCLRHHEDVKWGCLPKEFYNGGLLTGKHWSQGDVIPVPEDICLHHANWTIGIENKIAQLKYVRSVFDDRNR